MSKISLDGEPHAKTTFLGQSFEHGKNDSRHFHYRREACKQNKKLETTENVGQIGQMLVPGALNRSKKMLKAGADNFPKSSA